MALRDKRLIKMIVNEIGYQCISKGQMVHEKLVVFMVKAAILDSGNNFNVNEKLTKENALRLTMLCVNRLMNKKNPALDTIKMQLYFYMNYKFPSEFIREHRKVLQGRLLSIAHEVINCSPKNHTDFKDLYRKILYYTVLYSGVNPVKDVKSVRETTGALKSVFSKSKLAAFILQPREYRKQLLNEVVLSVTGMCLFKKISKGEKNCEDFPTMLIEELSATCSIIERDLEGTQRSAWQYTALVESPQSDCSVHPDLLKQALYSLRQHEAFLKLIQADVISCGNRVETLQAEFVETLKTLKATFKSNADVDTAQPHFKSLANIWVILQDESLVLSNLKNILLHLRTFLLAQTNLQKEGQLEQLFERVTLKSDQERMAERTDERVDPEEMKSCEWLFPESTDDFNKLRFQYTGMCGYTLIKEDGLLLPGNPNIGVLKHKERFYIFSSRPAAYEFASKADECIELVMEKAERSPELIRLLQLHQYGNMFRLGKKLQLKPITSTDSSTQTLTHVLEKNIVEPYEWNEWESRRKAIQLANIRQEVTHSTQTDLSHIRRETCTQTFLCKDAAGQTKKDGESNTPKPQHYLAQLRDKKTNSICVTAVNLTRGVEE